MGITTINLNASIEPIVFEKLVGESGVTPGMLVEINSADKIVSHVTAGGIASPLFALEDLTVAGTIDTVLTNNCVGRAGHFQSGSEVYAFVEANAAAVVIGDSLCSAGDGTLQKSGVASQASLTVTGAANGNLTFTAVNAGERGNDIQIVVETPAPSVGAKASATVTGAANGDLICEFNEYGIEGNQYQLVVLAATASPLAWIDGKTVYIRPDDTTPTATEAAALAMAVVAIANLVTVTAGGTGAGAPGTNAGVMLTGGLDPAGVTVDGLTITIVPDSTTPTATEVAALVTASVAASNLVTCTAGGTGAGVPGTEAGANLTGGSNDDVTVAFATQAVDNSLVAAKARIKVRVK